jgi:hypothetical protein
MRTARSPTYPQLGSASRARNSLWEFCFYDSSFLAQAAMMTLPLSRSCRRESTQNRHKGIRAARSRPHESEPSSQVPPRGRNRHGSFGEILRCGFSDSALKARRETHVGNRSRSACWGARGCAAMPRTLHKSRLASDLAACQSERALNIASYVLARRRSSRPNGQ